MKELLLADQKSSIMSWVVIGVVALLLIVMFFMMNARNKKESQKVQEQTNSLKVGDKVLTTSGVYGTITEIKFDDTRKLVVIETGGKEKSYLTFDAYAIYEVLNKENAAPTAEEPKVEETKAEVVEEKVEEKKQEPKKAPAKKPANKTAAKKNTTKKK